MAPLFHFGCILVLLITGTLTEINVVTAQVCNSITGPAGVSACVRIVRPYYNDYQWATCLSNAYIKLITANQIMCIDTTATYCWYQCMIETYPSLGSNVTGICLCNPNTQTTISPTTLNQSCYSPDGTSCDWYVSCLEKAYNCQGTAGGYAVQYGYTFCSRFSLNLNQFSALGQLWVNSVRKCLQACLAPLLRPYNAPTCDDIRTQAISSHTPCYFNMGCHMTASPNNVSICDLPMSDFFQVALTIWRAFVDPTTAAESVCGVFDVARSCAKSWYSTRTCMRSFVALVVAAPGTSQSTTTSPQFAASVANAISAGAGLNNLGVSVLGCQVPSSDPGELLINLLITAADDIGNCLKNLESSSVIGKRSSSSAIDYDAVASKVQRWVENASILNVNKTPVRVPSVGECDPMNCSNNTSRTITAPPVVWPTTISTSPSTSTSMPSMPPSINRNMPSSAAGMVSSIVLKLLLDITYLTWFIVHMPAF